MVFTHDLTHGLGGLLVGLVVGIAHFVHTEKHATVYGFETVAHIGERTRHNHRHRIVDVGRFHLILNIDFDNAIFFKHVMLILYLWF